LDRNWVLAGVALAVLMIAVPTMCGTEPSPPGPVLAIGDSLLFQSSEEVSRELQADGWEVRVDAVIGSGITGGGEPLILWPDRLAALVDEVDPEVVVIELGTNGCGPGCEGLETDIDELLDVVDDVPVVLWVGVRTDALLREDPVAINAALEEAAGDQNDLHILPMQDWFHGHIELLALDGVHLNQGGQDHFAHQLRLALRDHTDVD
jgi:lysophospholipase L1-like esterase